MEEKRSSNFPNPLYLSDFIKQRPEKYLDENGWLRVNDAISKPYTNGLNWFGDVPSNDLTKYVSMDPNFGWRGLSDVNFKETFNSTIFDGLTYRGPIELTSNSYDFVECGNFPPKPAAFLRNMDLRYVEISTVSPKISWGYCPMLDFSGSNMEHATLQGGSGTPPTSFPLDNNFSNADMAYAKATTGETGAQLPNAIPGNFDGTALTCDQVNSKLAQGQTFPGNSTDCIIPVTPPTTGTPYTTGKLTTAAVTTNAATTGKVTTGEVTTGEVTTGDITSGEVSPTTAEMSDISASSSLKPARLFTIAASTVNYVKGKIGSFFKSEEKSEKAENTQNAMVTNPTVIAHDSFNHALGNATYTSLASSTVSSIMEARGWTKEQARLGGALANGAVNIALGNYKESIIAPAVNAALYATGASEETAHTVNKVTNIVGTVVNTATAVVTPQGALATGTKLAFGFAGSYLGNTLGANLGKVVSGTYQEMVGTPKNRITEALEQGPKVSAVTQVTTSQATHASPPMN